MAIKTRYRLKRDNGQYEIIHFETSAEQVITSKECQFVNEEEKKKIQSFKPQHYTHNQIATADTWTITHNLNSYPSVTIVDSNGSVVTGDIEYLDQNSITIKFTAAFSGKAYLN